LLQGGIVIHRHRHLTALQRLIALAVVHVYALSISAAYLPHCACGVSCVHWDSFAPAVELDAPIAGECCSASKDSAGESVPSTGMSTPCGEGDGPCDCPVEIGDSANKLFPQNAGGEFPLAGIRDLHRAAQLGVIEHAQRFGFVNSQTASPPRRATIPRPTVLRFSGVLRI